mmetsp:Transcript_31008/g.101088  ORF Transcript_31008/g.101088 Transcript_31008/m.101088 type:complete len:283 (-) Transcript_31008:221-1069(-)
MQVDLLHLLVAFPAVFLLEFVALRLRRELFLELLLELFHRRLRRLLRRLRFLLLSVHDELPRVGRLVFEVRRRLLCRLLPARLGRLLARRVLRLDRGVRRSLAQRDALHVRGNACGGVEPLQALELDVEACELVRPLLLLLDRGVEVRSQAFDELLALSRAVRHQLQGLARVRQFRLAIAQLLECLVVSPQRVAVLRLCIVVMPRKTLDHSLLISESRLRRSQLSLPPLRLGARLLENPVRLNERLVILLRLVVLARELQLQRPRVLQRTIELLCQRPLLLH